MNIQEQKIYNLVREELTDDLRPKKYVHLVNSKFCGHCHHASLAMYNILGGKDCGYRLQKAVDELQITHYWLINKDNEIIDPTVEQYTDLDRKPPYDKVINNSASYRKTKATKLIISNVIEKCK